MPIFEVITYEIGTFKYKYTVKAKDKDEAEKIVLDSEGDWDVELIDSYCDSSDGIEIGEIKLQD